MSDGRCLSHAFSETKRRDDRGEKIKYVQGTVTNRHTKHTFQHAWVELTDKGKVVDPTTEVIMKKEEYYHEYNVKNVIRIDPFIAIMLFGRGLRFVTKDEVAKAVKRDKELMAQVIARRKKSMKG